MVSNYVIVVKYKLNISLYPKVVVIMIDSQFIVTFDVP